MSLKHNFSVIALCALTALPFSAKADGHQSAETVVATVNGTEITLGHMIVLKQRLPAQYQQLEPNVLFDGILEQLIQQTLLGDTLETVSSGAQLTIDNETRAILAGDAVQKIVADAITDEALQAEYEAAFGGSEPTPEFNASHILVETEEEAEALITELVDGADFAELAMEKSTGPSGPRGGELGWFGLGAMVAPFEVAVTEMEVGDISAPVQTQFGWHVIKLNETRIKDAPPLEEVRGQLVESLQQTAIEAAIADLTDSADITRVTTDDVDPALLDSVDLLEN